MFNIIFIFIFIVLLSRTASSSSTIIQASPVNTILSKNMANEKQDNLRVLVTGGAGYIGSHTIFCLLQSGYDVTVVDNLVNSNSESLKRVLEIAGLAQDSPRLKFYKVDLCNKNELEKVFNSSSSSFLACIHFAGLKAVGESVREPLLYYHNNIESTINLLQCLDKYDCQAIIFSSSATVRSSLSFFSALVMIDYFDLGIWNSRSANNRV
jgi:nucleoside-diphosphate-sugar epimerase